MANRIVPDPPKEKYDRLSILVRRDAKINGDYIREHAAARDESINSFLKRAVLETIAHDKGEGDDERVGV